MTAQCPRQRNWALGRGKGFCPLQSIAADELCGAYGIGGWQAGRYLRLARDRLAEEHGLWPDRGDNRTAIEQDANPDGAYFFKEVVQLLNVVS